MRKLLKHIGNLCFHPQVHKRTGITLLFTILALVINYTQLQVFCVPVWWAALLFVLFVFTLIVFPYLESPIVKRLAALLLGAGVFINVYCMIFLADPWSGYRAYMGYILGILVFGLGLFAFLPFYYLYHIARYFRYAGLRVRVSILLGLAIPVVVTAIYLLPFHERYQQFESACSSDRAYTLLKKDMYTEQFVGIGIKYHTKLDFIYDGWRPPVHNPLLNIGLWIYADTYYPCKSIYREKLYRELFPGRSYRVGYPCSFCKDGMSYFGD